MSRWTREELEDGASLCLEIGAGLLENGAETSRVEETIRMTGDALGIEVEAMVHPTGITVGFGGRGTVTRVARIKERAINLNKVAELNHLSRALHRGDLSLRECKEGVEQVRAAPELYTRAQSYLATAVSGGFLTAVVGGGIWEVLVAILAACSVRRLLELFGSHFPTFLSLFAVGFLCSLFGVAGRSVGLSSEAIVVGSLLQQMPGLAFVSAMRDLMAGELVAGNARLAEALLVTLGMATGVLACLSLAIRAGVT